MSIVLDGTSGITTPEIVSTGGPLVVNASAPDNSVVVDASGNVGIGTSSPKSDVGLSLHLFNSANTGTVASNAIMLVESANRNAVIELSGAASSTNSVVFSDTPGTSVAGIASSATDQNLIFRTGGTAERARIDSSGNLLVGATSSFFTTTKLQVTSSTTQTAGIQQTGGAANACVTSWNTAASGTIHHISFADTANGVVRGSITTNGTGTTYGTASDYRLKENVALMTGALARVAALKPVTYTWKSTGETDEGFIAHELQEVCPSAVTGEKDAVDAEGKPQYQGIDTSFLAGLYAAALQELKAINDAQAQTIESLTARVVALEQA